MLWWEAPRALKIRTRILNVCIWTIGSQCRSLRTGFPMVSVFPATFKACCSILDSLQFWKKPVLNTRLQRMLLMVLTWKMPIFCYRIRLVSRQQSNWILKFPAQRQISMPMPQGYNRWGRCLDAYNINSEFFSLTLNLLSFIPNLTSAKQSFNRFSAKIRYSFFFKVRYICVSSP